MRIKLLQTYNRLAGEAVGLDLKVALSANMDEVLRLLHLPKTHDGIEVQPSVPCLGIVRQIQAAKSGDVLEEVSTFAGLGLYVLQPCLDNDHGLGDL